MRPPPTISPPTLVRVLGFKGWSAVMAQSREYHARQPRAELPSWKANPVTGPTPVSRRPIKRRNTPTLVTDRTDWRWVNDQKVPRPFAGINDGVVAARDVFSARRFAVVPRRTIHVPDAGSSWPAFGDSVRAVRTCRTASIVRTDASRVRASTSHPFAVTAWPRHP